MTVKSQVPPVCIGDYLSNGTRLVEIRELDAEYISVLDCSKDEGSDQALEKIPVRRLGNDWYRVNHKDQP